MAYSIQREVSDGTLQTLTLRISYFKKTHIFVYVDDKLADGSTGRYSWVWDGDRIRLNKVVPVGIEVIIRRKTPMDAPFHNFRQGAVFKDVTMDENFIQQLYINQENVEGLSATDFYSDLDLHNYRMKNVGTATTDADAVSLGQYRADALGANQYRILAESSKVAAKASEVASAASAQIATTASRDAGSASVSAANSAASVGQVEQRVLVLRDQAETFSDYSATYAANSKVSADLSKGSEADARNSVTLAAKEADRAKAEADRAESIVGFEEVPFPDVWIPFNENLDMIAGINFAKKKVKFGEDTVLFPDDKTVSFSRAGTATYIDKSGVLRTAAVDEPRFEKEGLLIEGQSTNHLIHSKLVGGTQFFAQGEYSVEQVAGQPDVGDLKNHGGTAGGSQHRLVFPRIRKPSNLQLGEKATFSILIDMAGTTSEGIDFDANPWQPDSWASKASGTINIKGKSGLVKLAITTTCINAANTECEFNLYISPANTKVRIVGFQLEALPFATSYIPTSGDAATRAADKCWIQALNNISAGATIFAEYDLLGVTGNRQPIYYCATDNASCFTALYVTGNSWEFSWAESALAYSLPYVKGRSVVTRAAGIKYSILSGGVLQNAEVLGIKSAPIDRFTIGYRDSPAYSLFGHIRNFRIWHTALTDAQLKGLK